MDDATPHPTADLSGPHGGLPDAGGVRRLHPLSADLGAFLANPGLNGLILGVMLIGIVLAIRQVWRLFPEVRWVNTLRRTEEGFSCRPARRSCSRRWPRSSATGRAATALSIATTRSLLDSIGARLDESREIVRYLAGPAGVPRPARHLLGPDRDGRLGRPHHPVAADRPGCGGALRRAEERALAAPCRAWACPSRPRCSASPARSSSASSICRPARRRAASTPSSKIGSPCPTTERARPRACARAGTSPDLATAP